MVEHSENTNVNLAVNMPRLQAIAFMLMSSVKGVIKADFEQDELVVFVQSNNLLEILSLLEEHSLCRYEQLMDLCGADYPQREKRFDVVYNLLSVSLNQRIRIVTRTDEYTSIPSVRNIWKCADWWERECYDMFGVLFSGQPDLRRILTDYGFDGHPLRKDFPLTGYVEVRYDADQNKVVYEPVTLTQDLRDFDFDSPWEGLVTLPGDEKVHEKRQNIKPYSL